MKRNKILSLLFIAALFTVINLNAQNKSVSKRVFETAGISRQNLKKVDFNYTNLLYKQLTQNSTFKKAFNPAPGKPVVRQKASGTYLSTFIRSESPLKTKSYIESINGNVSNIINDILVVDIPVSKVSEVIMQNEISRIETAKYRKSLLDTSRTFINVDDVHNGDDLPKAYKGEGVVVGVLDSGIDWEHPAFSGDNGTRIQYLWDMSDDSNPPDGFDYGTEYTKEDIDAGNVNQKDNHGHGTHVASTAAGTAGADYNYTGVAPKSDIVFVKGFRENPYFADNDIVNGCNYIFQKAEELNKPVVTNLSLGGLEGNTGYSLYEEALTELIEPGKLIAAAAGNEGSQNLHLKYTMNGSSVEEAGETYWYVTDESNELTIITGYPKSDDFNVGLKVYSQELETVYTSEDIGFNESFFNEIIVIEGDTLGGLSIQAKEEGNDPYVFKLFFEYGPERFPTDEYIYSLYTYGSAEFNAWINDGEFLSESAPSANIYGGDSLMTIGSPSTAFEVICVGSFSTKLSWTNINGDDFNFDGTIKDRSSFSSMGPTRDGRIKPDISAPGQLIAAARSADGSFPEPTLLSDKVVLEQGTSMATPHITGIIALLLEQNPNLTYEEVLDALQSTAVTDELTGEVPNNEFGAGRVDAHAALQKVITAVDNESEIPDEFSLSQNYPNPFNPETTIKYQLKTTSDVNLNVYNVLGKKVAELVDEVKSPGSYQVSFDASDLASGIYFYRINAGSFNQVRKMMLVK